jgi:hypothetical protein
MPSITKERERAHTDQDAWQPGMGDSRSVAHVPGASSKEPELHQYLASLEYWSACYLPTPHLLLARSLSLSLARLLFRACSWPHTLTHHVYTHTIVFYLYAFPLCSLNAHRNRQSEAKTFIPLPSEKPSKTDVTHINDIGVPAGSGQLLVEGSAPYRRYAPVHAGDQIWQVPLMPTAMFVSMLITCLCLCMCLCLRFALVLALAWVFASASLYPRVWLVPPSASARASVSQ